MQGDDENSAMYSEAQVVDAIQKNEKLPNGVDPLKYAVMHDIKTEQRVIGNVGGLEEFVPEAPIAKFFENCSDADKKEYIQKVHINHQMRQGLTENEAGLIMKNMAAMYNAAEPNDKALYEDLYNKLQAQISSKEPSLKLSEHPQFAEANTYTVARKMLKSGKGSDLNDKKVSEYNDTVYKECDIGFAAKVIEVGKEIDAITTHKGDIAYAIAEFFDKIVEGAKALFNTERVTMTQVETIIDGVSKVGHADKMLAQPSERGIGGRE